MRYAKALALISMEDVMQKASGRSARHQLAESTARFHVVDRSLRLHVSRWKQDSAGLVKIIDDYWACERLVPSADMIPESIRANGEAALAKCNEAHARREDLLAARYRSLCDANGGWGVLRFPDGWRSSRESHGALYTLSQQGVGGTRAKR
jgi:hypothetical protein